jgi:hypothetical protein
MDIWNVWTALVTGLVFGANLGMLLAALLAANNSSERQLNRTPTSRGRTPSRVTWEQAPLPEFRR